MNAKGVGTSIYYPNPVPMMSYYSNKYGYTKEQFPGASSIAYDSIALPVGPHLEAEDLDYIVDSLTQVIDQVS